MTARLLSTRSVPRGKSDVYENSLADNPADRPSFKKVCPHSVLS